MEGPLLAPAQPYGFSLQGVKREKKRYFSFLLLIFELRNMALPMRS